MMEYLKDLKKFRAYVMTLSYDNNDIALVKKDRDDARRDRLELIDLGLKQQAEILRLRDLELVMAKTASRREADFEKLKLEMGALKEEVQATRRQLAVLAGGPADLRVEHVEYVRVGNEVARVNVGNAVIFQPVEEAAAPMVSDPVLADPFCVCAHRHSEHDIGDTGSCEVSLEWAETSFAETEYCPCQMFKLASPGSEPEILF